MTMQRIRTKKNCETVWARRVLSRDDKWEQLRMPLPERLTGARYELRVRFAKQQKHSKHRESFSQTHY